MAEPRNPSPNEDELSQQFLDLIAGLKPRQRAFLQHYLNPQSPGYGNATKSAELTGYAGEPGSVQLSVAGHRVAKNPKVQKVMAVVFERAGCTLELDAKVIFEAMTATRTRYLKGENNTIIATPPEPDHPTRVHAVEVKHRLLRSQPGTVTHQRLPAADSNREQAAEPEFCPGCREAQEQAAELGAADRAALRDVTKADDALRNAETPHKEAGDEREAADAPEDPR